MMESTKAAKAENVGKAKKAMKVMTIVGTRPEIIKLSRIIAELEKQMNHVLVHTGQNFDYELNEIFFNEMGIKKPDFFLDAVGESTAQTIGNIIFKADEVIAEVKPEAILLYGDTNSCLSVIAAKRRKIPVFHMEAGNRCFDERVPEELNRKIVDHLSDINLPLTEHARRYLINEGIKPETIIKSGSCMQEVLQFHRTDIAESNVLDRLSLTDKDYFVLSAHREENIDSDVNFQHLIETLNALGDFYGKRIVFSTHPRTMKKIQALEAQVLNPLIEIMKPLGFFDYIKLQQHAFCTISDSGTIAEEASLLGFPAITIRNAHERPEGMDEGVLVMSGLRKERVLQSVEIITSQYAQYGATRVVADYDAPNVSTKMVRIIQSYTDYINRTTWKKSV
ncbi:MULTISPECIES: non-hydrolyzing UDP-N-acetylglucosamine 2-epimerase [Cysteiniphilum]|uniref:non-hydrolyzing UDP-N-acetylglucosamine 2-epimerase n=1 Tax=Cysteiniphilum TaxID=2056696 RepID=UPI001CE2B808|nr:MULTISPECIES: UDP-N-acetylglucosamine 2-epimerase (non-hydrolyzing) [Cysteiniphilum]